MVSVIGGPSGKKLPRAVKSGGRDGHGKGGVEALDGANDEDTVGPRAGEGHIEVEVPRVPVIGGGD